MKKISIILFLFIISSQLFSQQETLKIIVQSGHYAPVMSIDYSADGKFIITGSKDKTLKLWEVATGREIRTFTGHTKSVTGVKFSPDGSKVVSVSYDQFAIVWSVKTGSQIISFKDSLDEIRNAIFTPDGKQILTPDGKQILTGGHKTNAILWDIKTGKNI